MFMWFSKITWGGQLPSPNGGTSPNATIVYSPSIDKVVGEVDTKEIVGKAE